MIISLDLAQTADSDDRPDFNAAFCTSDHPTGKLPSCDPGVFRPDPGGLYSNPGGVNTRVSLMVQGVENPSSYFCFTKGGRRVCYGHF